MKRFGAAFVAAALVASQVPTSAFAVSEYYAISRSVRALGMGGAFYGLSDDDGALFYNPAGLALVRGGERFNVLGAGINMSPNIFDVVSTISNGSGKSTQEIATSLEKFQGQAIYGSPSVSILSMYRKNFGLAILLPDAKVNLGLLGTGVDTSIEATAIADAGVVAGFGTAIPGTGFRFGVNGKGIVRTGGRKLFTIDDIAAGNSFSFEPSKIGGSGFGVDFDLGGIYEFQVPAPSPIVAARAAVTIQNLLASNFALAKLTDGSPPALARSLSLGGSLVFRGVGPFDNFNVLLDFAEFGIGGQSDPNLGGRGGSFWKHVNFGVEAPMGIFSPRLGLHQGYWTAGFSLDVRVLKLAFATYAEELSSGVGRFESRRYVARVEIGWGSAPPPPILGTERDQKAAEAAKTNEPVPNGGNKPEPAKPEAPPAAAPETAPTGPATAPPIRPEDAHPNAVDANGIPLSPPQLQVDKLVPTTEGPNPNLPRGGGNVPSGGTTPAPGAAPATTTAPAPAATPPPAKPQTSTRGKRPTRMPASRRP